MFSGLWVSMSSPYTLYIWLIALTGLAVGQMILSGFVVSALAEGPHQIETKVV